MRALLSTVIVVGLFTAAAVYAFDRWVLRPAPRERSLRDSLHDLDDIPRITLPWGAIPTGVH